MKQVTEQNFEHLIDKMFEMAGHEVRYKDVKGRQDQWYLNWTMSQIEYNDWKNYVVDYLRKTLKFPKGLAEKEAVWFCMNYGLKFEN